MGFFTKLVIGFLALTGAVALGTGFLGMDFGTSDYWNHHGFFFLVGLAIFPRLTLLFSSVASGGLIWWASWVFAPRILVAVLATVAYWRVNPVLVLIAWLFAVGGESSEKYATYKRARVIRVVRNRPWGNTRRGYDNAKPVESQVD